MNGELVREVPVLIPPDDDAQQLLHMSGLVYASCFKLKQVTAPGSDPLARGWTRGGEIYLWVAKGVKTEQEIHWPPLAAVRAAAGGGPSHAVGRRDRAGAEAAAAGEVEGEEAEELASDTVEGEGHSGVTSE